MLDLIEWNLKMRLNCPLFSGGCLHYPDADSKYLSAQKRDYISVFNVLCISIIQIKK